MNEQLAFLRLVVSRLETARIPYMVTGSIALAVYAVPRMTRDVDVVIDGDEEQVAALVAAFVSDSYASDEAAREAVRTEGMFNVIHNQSLLKADFIVRTNDAFSAERFARRRTIDLGLFAADVISPEDLVLSKLLWSRGTGSTRQHEDVQTLLRSVPNLDWSYLSTWAARLDVLGTLDRLNTP